MGDDEAEAYASMASSEGDRRNLSWTESGAESGAAAAREPKPEALRLMEAVVERSNMFSPNERVVKNQGAPGVDGLTVSEFKPWLQRHWARVRQDLLSGVYQPEMMRKVETPKPQGGVRILGVPTLGDRLIQQALNQILQPLFDPEFSESSFGFRPGRNAHQAVGAAQGYVAAGKRWTVDLDLEKFFEPGKPRCADGTGRAQGGRWTGIEADPALSGRSGSGNDGRRGSEHADGGYASGRSAVPNVIEYSARRS
jgi:RNA-directed DNA polymerase